MVVRGRGRGAEEVSSQWRLEEEEHQEQTEEEVQVVAGEETRGGRGGRRRRWRSSGRRWRSSRRRWRSSRAGGGVMKLQAAEAQHCHHLCSSPLSQG